MNTPTSQRDQIAQLAKSKNAEAYKKAKDIKDPWFKAQALAHVARYGDDKAIKYSNEAIKTADSCDDEYKKVAVLAWVIAALAETKHLKQASSLLMDALNKSKNITPNSSKSEALILLLQAAFKIDVGTAKNVVKTIESALGNDTHWRCKRAIKDAKQLISGEMKPREFFW